MGLLVVFGWCWLLVCVLLVVCELCLVVDLLFGCLVVVLVSLL